MADTLEFKPYNALETRGILEHRKNYAFVPNVWDDDAFNIVVQKTAELKDLRVGLYLMREAATLAESHSSRKIIKDYAEKSLGKLDDFFVKEKEKLKDHTQDILSFVKKNAGKRIGDLHKLFVKDNYELSYKTFQRNIKKLADNNFISVEKIDGGALGNTTIVKSSKKLTDF
jgi:Cdc6-like AAA superfamily ATPase